MTGPSILCGRQELPGDEWKDPPMLGVIDLDRRINSARDGDGFGTAICASDAERQVLLRFEASAEAKDIVGFRAIELQCLSSCAFLKLQGQNTHADKV